MLFFFIPFLPLLILLISSAAMAGEIDTTRAMSFGIIDIHPGGDNVTINASTGLAVPVSSRSIITDGKSGLIRISSTIEEHVDIIYPSSVVLRTNTNTLQITNIADNSEYNIGGVDLTGGIPVDIDIGGKINFTGGELDGHYSGYMQIIIAFE